MDTKPNNDNYQIMVNGMSFTEDGKINAILDEDRAIVSNILEQDCVIIPTGDIPKEWANIFEENATKRDKLINGSNEAELGK